ncbi:MAG TPA: glycoside hydrolase family 3 N-terminal domain-containing protein [Solirubrobacteraceae bacterium]|nr:glycoside hydrolase family 3 N-terminal domain-containing protein [Solirubrobacteraceae bacterium]
MIGGVVRVPVAAALLAVVLLAPAAAGARPVPDASPRDALAGLTVRQLAGQRVIVGWAGPRVPAWLLARVRRGEVGGVIAFSRNVASRGALAAQMRRLQRARRPLAAPLLTMIDQEGGLVARLPGAPSGSPARMGRRGAAYVRGQGRLTAANLRGAGMRVNLAPVVDLGRPGSYQARTGRAFARRPAAVAALGTAFARGLQEGGVAATLKHFPGLGAVRRDEDALIQTVGLSAATLRRADEVPFSAGIRGGARLVMTSTARYPALDGRRVALLSRRITTTELRVRLGFRGVTITDDLDVTAMRRLAGPSTLAVRASAAGNDLLLFAQDPDRARRGLSAVVAAVRAGRLSRAELVASVRRIAALRAAVR